MAKVFMNFVWKSKGVRSGKSCFEVHKGIIKWKNSVTCAVHLYSK